MHFMSYKGHGITDSICIKTFIEKISCRILAQVLKCGR